MKRLLLTSILCMASLTGCGGAEQTEAALESTADNETTITMAETNAAPDTTETTAQTATTAAVKTTITESEVTVDTTETAEVETVVKIVYSPSPTELAVEEIGKKLEITEVIRMAGELIGANDGTSFMYNGHKYEIYEFEAGHATLADASDGTATIWIEGIGTYEVPSAVNRNFVMIYSEADEVVIEAFKSLELS